MKYLVKNTTAKTIWKKILTTNSNQKMGNNDKLRKLEEVQPIKLNKVKLCTWSRNFDWDPFKMQLSGPK